MSCPRGFESTGKDHKQNSGYNSRSSKIKFPSFNLQNCLTPMESHKAEIEILECVRIQEKLVNVEFRGPAKRYYPAFGRH